MFHTIQIVEMPSAVVQFIQEHERQNHRKIDLIKTVRAISGLGLKEAKTLTDNILANDVTYHGQHAHVEID